MLEAIVRKRAGALGDEEVCAREPVERGLETWVVRPAYSGEQRIGEISRASGTSRNAGVQKPAHLRPKHALIGAPADCSEGGEWTLAMPI